MAEGLIVRRAQRQFPFAVGGTETVIEQDGKFYRVHTYTDVGTDDFEVLRGGEVEYLVVAGGGGGGNTANTNTGNAGGGGAGGLIVGVAPVIPQLYQTKVGQGGAGVTNSQAKGNDGENSSAFNFVAIGGGGGGGHQNEIGNDGGSGGGSGTSSPRLTINGGIALQPLSASGGFGQNGGQVLSSSGDGAGSGGGGAGSVGGSSFGNAGSADGGDGLAFDINGTLTFYSGGGASGSFDGPQRFGGLGGGGNGEFTTQAESGQQNTGGGGGGGASNAGPAGNVDSGSGGSGIVIVRYRITQAEYEAA